MNLFAKIFKTIHCFLAIVRDLLTLCLILVILIAAALFLAAVSMMGESNGRSAENKPLPLSESHTIIITLNSGLADADDQESALEQFIRELGDGGDQPDSKDSYIIAEAIGRFCGDDNVKNVILSLDDFAGGSLGNIELIGKKLGELRECNKKIIASGSSFTQPSYYLASFADEILLDPAGSVDVHGFALSSLYGKTLLGNIGVTPNVFRAGRYKSAVEPFIRDNMSDDSRSVSLRLINGLWEMYENVIYANRPMKEKLLPKADELLAILKKAGGIDSSAALARNLVDKLMTRSEREEYIKEKFGVVPDRATPLSDYISANDISRTTEEDTGSEGNSSRKIIAVVTAEGEIAKLSEDGISSDTLVPLLKKLQGNDRVKAVVLRLNSPGGDVFASRLIRSEIDALQKKGIKVVVSMGEYAASGGYLISAGADWIVAEPQTLTGSIGVFGILPEFSGLSDRIGVYEDGVENGSNEFHPLRKMPESQKQIIQASIDGTYDYFVGLVSRGRHMNTLRVLELAGGQVWTGKEAVENGLADSIGGLSEAVSKARELAGKDGEYLTVSYFPEESETGFLRSIRGQAARILLPADIRQEILTALGTARKTSAAIRPGQYVLMEERLGY
jgi:protease-4